MVVIIENPITIGQWQTVFGLIGRVFLRVEPISHHDKYTGFPYFMQVAY